MNMTEMMEIANEAQVDVQEFLAEFMAEWQRPINNIVVQKSAQKIMAMPEEAKKILQQKHPEGWKKLMKKAGGQNGSNQKFGR